MGCCMEPASIHFAKEGFFQNRLLAFTVNLIAKKFSCPNNFFLKCSVHGGGSWSGPNPKGGGVPPSPLQTPKLLYRTMGFVGAGDFVLGIWQGEILVLDPMSVLKILRNLWRIQKWLKSTNKDFNPDLASGSDLG